MENKKKKQGVFFNKFNFLIHNFCGKSSGRPELGGVFVSPAHTVSTDSFKIIKVDTPKGLDPDDYPIIPNKPKPLNNFKSFILPKDEAKEVLEMFRSQKSSKSLPILDYAVLLKNDKENVEIGKTNLESFRSVSSRKIVGEYPRYQDLFVERGKYIEISVNPSFLKEIVNFYVSFIDKPLKELKIKVPIEKTNPIRFYAERQEGQKAVALLMAIEDK